MFRSQSARQRAVSAAAATSAFLCLAGCVSTVEVNSQMRARRMARFDAWQRERARGSAEREVVSGPLSLERSIFLALGSSREIRIALLDREIADTVIAEARAAAYPRIDADVTYSRLDMVSSFDVAPGISVAMGDKNNLTLNGTLVQALYRGGAVEAGVRAANIFAMLADQQVRETYQGVLFEVRKGYYDARLALELERASAEAVRVARYHLDDMRKNRKAGAASNFDVLRADVELKNLMAQHVQDQNRYNRDLAALLNVIGVSQESRVELTYPLTYEPLQPDMADAVRQAFLDHPELLRGELDVRIRQQALRVARAEFFPKVDAFFTETYGRPDPSDSTHIAWGDAWVAGIRLTVPLFTGFATRARVARERITLSQSEITLRDTEERLLLEIRQAILSIADAAKFVESQQASIEQAKEALRLVELGLRQGIRRQVEVLDAQRALTDARANHAKAVYGHEVARLALERATGTLDPPPTPAAKE